MPFLRRQVVKDSNERNKNGQSYAAYRFEKSGSENKAFKVLKKLIILYFVPNFEFLDGDADVNTDNRSQPLIHLTAAI